MRADPPPMTQGTSAKAVVGLWPPSMIRTRRAAFAQSGNRFRSGQTRSICREIIHKNISDSNSVRSDHDPLRASNPEIPQFIACLCRPQNGQPISSWSFCTLAALRQNAKKKTPASWAIGCPGRFFRRGPRPNGPLAASLPAQRLRGLAPRHRAARNRGITLRGQSIKSPGSLRGFEARCLLEAAPAPPLPGQLVRCAVWSAWLNMAFSDAAISVGELAV